MISLVALTAVGVCLAIALYVGLWLGARPQDPALERRLRRVAAVLGGERVEDEQHDAEVSVFRTRRIRSRLVEQLDERFCLLEGRDALRKAVAVGVLAALAAAIMGLVMQLGSLLPLAVPAAWAGGAWVFLTMWDKRTRVLFVKQFPEIVDHVVRLARAGLPAVEAISVMAAEAPEPARSILKRVSDQLATGLEPDVVLREAGARVRIPEFTLFTAALALQRSTGGSISVTLGNLAATVRTRMEMEMKAHAATAQTRMTLWVLAAVPVLVLGGQGMTNPESLAVLFETESGAKLLRWGIALIVAGLLMARAIAARVAR